MSTRNKFHDCGQNEKVMAFNVQIYSQK